MGQQHKQGAAWNDCQGVNTCPDRMRRGQNGQSSADSVRTGFSQHSGASRKGGERGKVMGLGDDQYINLLHRHEALCVVYLRVPLGVVGTSHVPSADSKGSRFQGHRGGHRGSRLWTCLTRLAPQATAGRGRPLGGTGVRRAKTGMMACCWGPRRAIRYLRGEGFAYCK